VEENGGDGEGGRHSGLNEVFFQAEGDCGLYGRTGGDVAGGLFSNPQERIYRWGLVRGGIEEFLLRMSIFIERGGGGGPGNEGLGLRDLWGKPGEGFRRNGVELDPRGSEGEVKKGGGGRLKGRRNFVRRGLGGRGGHENGKGGEVQNRRCHRRAGQERRDWFR